MVNPNLFVFVFATKFPPAYIFVFGPENRICHILTPALISPNL